MGVVYIQKEEDVSVKNLVAIHPSSKKACGFIQNGNPFGQLIGVRADLPDIGNTMAVETEGPIEINSDQVTIENGQVMAKGGSYFVGFELSDGTTLLRIQ